MEKLFSLMLAWIGALGGTLVATDLEAPIEWKSVRQEVVLPPGEAKTELVFAGRNVSSIPVRIAKTDVPCSCTTLQFDDAPIQPGDTLQVRIAFDGTGRAGTQTKRVQLSFAGEDGRAMASVDLNFTVELTSLIQATPRILLWRLAEEPEFKPKTVRLKVTDNRAKPAIKLDAPGHFDVKLVAIDQEGTYEIITRPTASGARAASLLTISLPEAQSKELLRIPLMVR